MLFEVLGYNKRKRLKLFKKKLLRYLISMWQLSRDPSLKELVNNLPILDNKSNRLLIKMLRHLRVKKVLDGYYDQLGIYRIGEFT